MLRIRDLGSSAFILLDPGWKNIRIRDKHLGSNFRELVNNFLS
jgi:hypothetical protein